jgi:hypothetical protein
VMVEAAGADEVDQVAAAIVHALEESLAAG